MFNQRMPSRENAPYLFEHGHKIRDVIFERRLKTDLTRDTVVAERPVGR
jgi:hypothetical protein